jgi:ATP-dependent DNA helicase RecQ
VLVGGQGHEVLSRGLDRIPTYGKLSALPLDYVKELLNVLADSGLVERRGIEGGRPGAFVLALTPEGRAVAKGEVRPELDLPPPHAPRARSSRAARQQVSEPNPDDADPELLARLKGWRTEEARRRSMPPYVVFHDRTLAAIAAARPGTTEELGSIKGVGPAKLAAYGKALLELIR